MQRADTVYSNRLKLQHAGEHSDQKVAVWRVVFTGSDSQLPAASTRPVCWDADPIYRLSGPHRERVPLLE